MQSVPYIESDLCICDRFLKFTSELLILWWAARHFNHLLFQTEVGSRHNNVNLILLTQFHTLNLLPEMQRCNFFGLLKESSNVYCTENQTLRGMGSLKMHENKRLRQQVFSLFKEIEHYCCVISRITSLKCLSNICIR